MLKKLTVRLSVRLGMSVTELRGYPITDLLEIVQDLNEMDEQQQKAVREQREARDG